MRRNSSAIGMNPDAEKHRLAALARVNQVEGSDEEKRIEQLEKI